MFFHIKEFRSPGAGGRIGAWAAQQLLLHKTRKASFRELYWFTVIGHCALLGAWFRWIES